jgi:putative hydroxymethylpyrimidine transporter CytX
MEESMDIRPIPAAGRTLGGFDYLLLWAGVGISLAEIWAGGFLTPMGLWAGLAAIVIGHLIGNTFMALGGVIGSDQGIMSMVSIRPAFGIRGSNLAAVLNIIQLIGWAAVMLIIGGRAGAMLGQPVGGVLASNHFWIIAIGLVTLIWAHFTGGGIWKILQKIAVIGLFVVVVLMSWAALSKFGQASLAVPPKDMPFMIGLDLVIAMPISWMPLVSDYSRFAKSTGPAFWTTWLGYFLVSSWMYALGLIAALVIADKDPSVLILQTMTTFGLAAPALALAVFSTITSTFPDVYSAACSTVNITQRLSTRSVLWIIGIIAIALALIFPMEHYEHFLLFIGSMFVPLFGVVLTDYFICRKRELDVDAIYERGGRYWYTGGFHIPALVAWALGFLLFQGIAWMKIPVGGSIPALVLAGVAYYVFFKMGRR